MSVSSPYITVFTPTFNRAHTLPCVYHSLCKQTFRDFEWVIVDDGSVDGTNELVNQWILEKKISIRYFQQTNQGKHVAHNRAVDEARGELFLVFDSDDSCVINALEKFKYYWCEIPDQQRERFSTVTALCVNKNGRIIGSRFPEKVSDVSDVEGQIKLRISGERFGINRTKVLKENKFPVFPGEKFVPEGLVWNRISKNYSARFINEPLRIFDFSVDGLTANNVRIRMKSPRGAALYYFEQISLPIGVKMKIKAIANYVRFSLHGRQFISTMNFIINRPYMAVPAIVGLCMYIKDLATLS